MKLILTSRVLFSCYSSSFLFPVIPQRVHTIFIFYFLFFLLLLLFVCKWNGMHIRMCMDNYGVSDKELSVNWVMMVLTLG